MPGRHISVERVYFISHIVVRCGEKSGQELKPRPQRSASWQACLGWLAQFIFLNAPQTTCPGMALPQSLPTSIIHQENSSTDLSTGQDNRGIPQLRPPLPIWPCLCPSISVCQLLAGSGPYFLCNSLPSDSILDWESCRGEKGTRQIGGVGWVLLGGARADSWSSHLTNEDRDPRDGVQGDTQGLLETLSPGWVFLCYLAEKQGERISWYHHRLLPSQIWDEEPSLFPLYIPNMYCKRTTH